MKIFVEETHHHNKASEIIDESRFLELYGQFDLDKLKEKGTHGDVIGQDKTYTARIVSTDGFEDSGLVL